MSETLRFFRGAEDKTGRELHIVRSSQIAEGTFGTIKRISAILDVQTEPKTLTVKEYVNTEACERAVARYNIVKRNNLPTWTSYDISADKKSVLIDIEENPEDVHIVSLCYPHERNKGDDEITLFQQKIPDVSNFEAAVRTLLDALKNVKEVVNIEADAFFCKYNHTTSTMSFFVGDFDQVNIFNDDEAAACLKLNRERVLDQLFYFIRDYVSEEMKGKFYTILNKIKAE